MKLPSPLHANPTVCPRACIKALATSQTLLASSPLSGNAVNAVTFVHRERSCMSVLILRPWLSRILPGPVSRRVAQDLRGFAPKISQTDQNRGFPCCRKLCKTLLANDKPEQNSPRKRRRHPAGTSTAFDATRSHRPAPPRRNQAASEGDPEDWSEACETTSLTVGPDDPRVEGGFAANGAS